MGRLAPLLCRQNGQLVAGSPNRELSSQRPSNRALDQRTTKGHPPSRSGRIASRAGISVTTLLVSNGVVTSAGRFTSMRSMDRTTRPSTPHAAVTGHHVVDRQRPASPGSRDDVLFYARFNEEGAFDVEDYPHRLAQFQDLDIEAYDTLVSRALSLKSSGPLAAAKAYYTVSRLSQRCRHDYH